MPEINFCLFDLKLLFNLYSSEDKSIKDKFVEYERKTQFDMAENRLKLFEEF